MLKIQGYYNDVVCIPLERGKLRKNQKVLITALDEEIVPPIRRLGALEGLFSQISFPARYSVVYFQLESSSLRFREVIIDI